jgi:hypothetical protein
MLAQSALARIGETESELVTRYGAVVTRQPMRKSAQGAVSLYGERLSFKSTDWNIAAVLIAGKCEEISYTKAGQWTPVQIRFVLDLNGGVKSWKEKRAGQTDAYRNWTRADGTTAKWSAFSGFIVRTTAAEAALRANEK